MKASPRQRLTRTARSRLRKSGVGVRIAPAPLDQPRPFREGLHQLANTARGGGTEHGKADLPCQRGALEPSYGDVLARGAEGEPGDERHARACCDESLDDCVVVRTQRVHGLEGVLGAGPRQEAVARVTGIGRADPVVVPEFFEGYVCLVGARVVLGQDQLQRIVEQWIQLEVVVEIETVTRLGEDERGLQLPCAQSLQQGRQFAFR